MSYIERYSVSVVNSSTGGGTATSASFTGTGEAVEIASGLSTATVTVATTRGQTILSGSLSSSAGFTTYFPRQQVHTSTGGGLSFSTTGGEVAAGKVVMAKERFTLTVASGTAGETASVGLLVS